MKIYGNEFSVNEIARKLHCSSTKVYKLIEDGKLVAQNVGFGRQRPRYVVREDDLYQYLNNLR